MPKKRIRRRRSKMPKRENADINIKPLLRGESEAPKQEYVNWRWEELKPERRRKFKEPKPARSRKAEPPKYETPKQENIRLAKCATCNGVGEIAEEYFKVCDYCRGSGFLYSGGGCPADSTWGSDFVPATKECCHRCEGTGRRRMKRKGICPKCEGHKVIIVRG